MFNLPKSKNKSKEQQPDGMDADDTKPRGDEEEGKPAGAEETSSAKKKKRWSPKGAGAATGEMFSALSKPFQRTKSSSPTKDGDGGGGEEGTPGKKKQRGESSGGAAAAPPSSPFDDALKAMIINPVSEGSKALTEGVRKLTGMSPQKKKDKKKKKGVASPRQLESAPATSAAEGGAGGGGDVQEPLPAPAAVALEPDRQLQSMNVIITKTLKGVGVQDWYETCWSEGVRTDKEPFYGPWLSGTGKSDVRVEDWTFAAPADGGDSGGSGPIVGDWDKETYRQVRKVTFKMERTSGLYPGSTETSVEHTQFCRLEGGGRRCVVSTTVRTEGIPFADSFYVVIRWVGTAVGSDLSVQVGLFVVFVKQVIVAGKIRSATTQKTTEAQLGLFRHMKATCTSTAAEENKSESEGSEAEEEGGQIVAVGRSVELSQQQPPPLFDMLSQHMHKMVALCFPFWVKSGEEDESDDIERVMREIRSNIGAIRSLPSPGNVSGNDDALKYVLEEFENAQGALDKAMMKCIGKDSEHLTREAPSTEGLDEPAALGTFSKADKYFSSLMHPFQQVASIGEAFAKSVPLAGSPKKEKKEEAKEDSVAPVDGPDKVLQSMTVVIDKTIANTSISEIFDRCLSEKESFYKRWLEGVGATEVAVGDWVIAKEGESFTDGWSDETYSRKRKVTYSIQRKSVLGYEAVPCEITQNHYLRRFEGDKKLVLQASMTASGLPFADTHTDMVRHVYTQTENGGISAKCGIFILQTKRTMLSRKVRVEATQEATKRQLELFRSLRAAIGGGTSEASVERYIDVQKELQKMQPFPCVQLPSLQSCLSRTQRLTQMYPDGSLEDVEAVSEQLDLVSTKVQAIEPFLARRFTGEDMEKWRFILTELELVDQALDNIIEWHGDQVKGKEALNRASFE